MWNFICLVFVLFLVVTLIFMGSRKPRGYPPGYIISQNDNNANAVKYFERVHEPAAYLYVEFINKVMPKNCPIWLPLIGCFYEVKKLHLKTKYHHLAWNFLQKKYGQIVGLKLGSDRVVIVSGYECIKEISCRESFEGRPDGFFFRQRAFGERLGVVFVDGPFMHEQRKFCLNQLRKLGYGTSSMNNIVINEAQEFVKLISSKCEKPIYVHHLLDVVTLNVLWTIMAGYRFSWDDKKLLQLLELVHKAFRVADMSGGVLNQMPFLRYLAPTLSGYKLLASFIDEMFDFLRDILGEHSQTDKKNFISVFLEKIRENDGTENNAFTEKQLLVLMEDFFMAGTETTSSSLLFIIYYLMIYPEVQRRVHEELDLKLGPNQVPTMMHRQKLIYLEATIMEAQRLSNIVPFSLPHRALGDEKFMGYSIPKDTILILNIYGLHMDETYWGDPHKFRPERFIDETGTTILQHSHFMPFGTGRRKCIGEILAKTNLLLFVALILQKFELKSPVDNPSVEILDGMTLSLAPFKVKFIPRHS